MALGKVKKGLQLNDFETRLEKISQMYPGKFPLVSLPGNVYGRIIDFHKAPVKGYYNAKKDLADVEVMAKVPKKDAEGGYAFAPTSPVKIMRSRVDCMELIGVL